MKKINFYLITLVIIFLFINLASTVASKSGTEPESGPQAKINNELIMLIAKFSLILIDLITFV